MKVLTIDALFFKLPDDFEGGLSDALRVMADYHDAPKTREGQKRETNTDRSTPWRQMRDKMWLEFLEQIKGGQRLRGSVCICETEGDETTTLDLNTGDVKEKKS